MPDETPWILQLLDVDPSEKELRILEEDGSTTVRPIEVFPLGRGLALMGAVDKDHRRLIVLPRLIVNAVGEPGAAGLFVADVRTKRSPNLAIREIPLHLYLTENFGALQFASDPQAALGQPIEFRIDRGMALEELVTGLYDLAFILERVAARSKRKQEEKEKRNADTDAQPAAAEAGNRPDSGREN